MGPTCGIYLRFSLLAVTAKKFRGLFGCSKSKNFALNHVFIGKRSGMGCLIGPKTWDRIVELFLDFLDSREPLETVVGCYVGIYALNSVLVSRRPEMGMEFGSKKWN